MKYALGNALRPVVLGAVLATIIGLPAMAADLTVTMRKTTQDGTGDAVGTITITFSDAGAALQLDLQGLPPGPHGFHLHENGNCGPTVLNGTRIPGGAAGGHLDPDHTGVHSGPAGQGHLGDLPRLDADAGGTVKQTLTAARIRNAVMMKGRALIIHAGGDNYSDSPAVLGGGGGRFACGVVG